MRRAALLFLAFSSCTSGSGGTPDGGSEAGADGGVPAFAGYTGPKCDYSVGAPPGAIDVALDASRAVVDMMGSAPVRVRLGLGGGTDSSAKGYADPSRSVVVTWESIAPDPNAKVRLGKNPAQLDDVRSGYTWTTPPPMTGLGTNDPPASLHEVHLCGLEPGTTYTYQVGGGAAGQELWSAPQTFTTAPATGPVRIGVSGDSRDSKDVFAMVQRRMATAPVNLQIFTGDVVVFGTSDAQYTQWLDAIWRDPMAQGKFLTLGQQLMVMLPGNHDASSPQFFGNFALPGTGDFAEAFGSFDVGPVHFLFWDDQRLALDPQSAASKAILDFIKADLGRANAKRAQVPFVVMAEHRGPFSTSNHQGDSDLVRVRDLVAPLAEMGKVDLFLSGHDHEYERSKPLTGPAANPTVQPAGMGTVYVIAAGAGANAYGIGGTPVAYREKNVAFGSSTPYVGVYLLMDASGTTLDVKAYGMKASASNPMGDDVIDQFTLTH